MTGVLVGRPRKEYMRCDDCGRILFPRRDGKLPPHKVPAPRRPPHPGKASHQPLTSKDAKWCAGGN